MLQKNRIKMIVVLAFTSLFFCDAKGTSDSDEQRPWKPAAFSIIKPAYQTVTLNTFANVYSGAKNSITRLAPELVGLNSIKLPLTKEATLPSLTITISFKSPVKLLVGIFNDSLLAGGESILNTIDFGKGSLNTKPVLANGLSITGMPLVNVYAISFSKGVHTISYQGGKPWLLLGAVDERQHLIARNAGMPDGRLWEPFLIEGFSDAAPLFQIVGGANKPVVDEGMPGTEGIQGGFEGGAIVKVNDTYHMFPTERAGEKGEPAYYDRVKTRIGHWTSKDAVQWKRAGTIYQASGVYAVTEDDNPLNDRRGAIWSYMPVFNKEKNRWYGYYLTYTVHKEIAPNHSFGRIWRTESKTPGIEGIAGPYDAGELIIEPGLNTQLWEGRQGVASFFPYPVGDHYLGFYAGAYPYLRREDYPKTLGKGWFVGLAKADSLEGPWTRLDTSINPVKTIHPWFVENPIVYQMPNGLYLAVFDGGPEGWGHHLPNMMAYTLSVDGYHWSEAHYLPIETKVKKWWDIMRTPLCLIPEGNNEYTIVYAAIQTSRRFHPMGMVKLKLNPAVLDEKKKELLNVLKEAKP
jgi:hypothetical protein